MGNRVYSAPENEEIAVPDFAIICAHFIIHNSPKGNILELYEIKKGTCSIPVLKF